MGFLYKSKVERDPYAPQFRGKRIRGLRRAGIASGALIGGLMARSDGKSHLGTAMGAAAGAAFGGAVGHMAGKYGDKLIREEHKDRLDDYKYNYEGAPQGMVSRKEARMIGMGAGAAAGAALLHNALKNGKWKTYGKWGGLGLAGVGLGATFAGGKLGTIMHKSYRRNMDDRYQHEDRMRKAAEMEAKLNERKAKYNKTYSNLNNMSYYTYIPQTRSFADHELTDAEKKARRKKRLKMAAIAAATAGLAGGAYLTMAKHTDKATGKEIRMGKHLYNKAINSKVGKSLANLFKKKAEKAAKSTKK